MVAVVLPLLFGVGAYFAGRSGGGGAMEIGTWKKQEMTIIAPFMPYTYAPVTTTTQTYIMDSPYARAGIEVTPTGAVTPMTQMISPIQAQAPVGGGAGAGGGFDWLTIAIIGGGAWYLFGRKKK